MDEQRKFPWLRGLTIGLPWTLLGLFSVGLYWAAIAFEWLSDIGYWISWECARWADSGLGFKPLTREEDIMAMERKAMQVLLENLREINKHLEQQDKDHDV